MCVCMGIREKREGVGILGEMVYMCVWAQGRRGREWLYWGRWCVCVYGHKGEEGGSGYIGGDGVYVCMGTREKREGVVILGEMVCMCVWA